MKLEQNHAVPSLHMYVSVAIPVDVLPSDFKTLDIDGQIFLVKKRKTVCEFNLFPCLARSEPLSIISRRRQIS